MKASERRQAILEALCERRSDKVENLAFEFQVNPNTVQKSLQILEDEGLIVTDRTNGKFVAGNSKMLEFQKNKIISQEVDLFFEKMKSLGLSIKEIKELINKSGE